MAAEKNYVRLGLFVLIGLVVMIATGLFFLERARSREVIKMVTYTTENVTGLDVSSPVKYRGVPVGRVDDIRVNPDGTTIEIDFEVFTDRLTSIGAKEATLRGLATAAVLPRLRARIVGNPVTGEAYVLLDIPKEPTPPMALNFTPTRPYVPAMPSPMAAVQDRIPAILESAQTTLQTLTEIIAKVPDSLQRSDRFFTSIERVFREAQLPELSAELRSFSRTSTRDIGQIRADLDDLLGPEGALNRFAEEARQAIRDADVPKSSQAARDAADRTILAADDLRRSLPAMREALEQMRELARRLEEQPESVVYGPRKPKGKEK